jgi:hypothetical protein
MEIGKGKLGQRAGRTTAWVRWLGECAAAQEKDNAETQRAQRWRGDTKVRAIWVCIMTASFWRD